MKVIRITEEKDFNEAYRIRKNVFVEEQGVPAENEFDAYETHAQHILVYYDNKPVATGRIRIIDNVAKLERICVLASYRKYGLGKVAVDELEIIAKEKGITKAKLHAQTQAKGFYERLGYIVNSEQFMEEGMPHFSMIKDLCV